MGLVVEPAESGADIKAFVDLPFSLYANQPLWIPPLRKQEINLLTPGRHPFWQTAKRQLFIAKDNAVPIGRIAAIIDNKYNAYAGENCGSFGFFECSDNQQAANGLLNAAAEWLKNAGMEFMRGPFNPSANYSCGMLVQGFQEAPALMMPWNPASYPAFVEQWGMRKEQDLFAYVIDRPNLQLSGWLKTEADRLKNEGRFTCRPASKKTMSTDIHAMLDIYQKAWANNWGFSPLSDGEAKEHVKELKDVIDPDFFVLFFHNDQAVAGMVALPDLTPLLRRLNGNMGLTAPWHYLRSKKEIAKGLRIMLFGILPEYRLYGLPLLLLDYMLEKAKSRPELQWVEGSWILESNSAMNDLMEDFSGNLAKRYRIYRKELGSC